MFETYTAKLADMIATAPACLALAPGDSNDRIAAAIDFVEQRCPGWSEGFPTSPSGGELRPVPLAWSRQIAIAGLRDAPGEHALVQDADEVPASYAIYAERHDGSLEWLGTAASISHATRLTSAIGSASAPRMLSALTD